MICVLKMGKNNLSIFCYPPGAKRNICNKNRIYNII